MNVKEFDFIDGIIKERSQKEDKNKDKKGVNAQLSAYILIAVRLPLEKHVTFCPNISRSCKKRLHI